ncbi:unnamed protein product [Toxocara canis]|uniref:Uncharacterized protein n=1 Tax=Toxocara canis TaxID=6265 RepID=A0A3P7H3B8_TOXCA|nr:unnamed protein product [Toxocara canis]
MVDFGWFKWVLAEDVIDISSMDKELIKGNDYEITMKSSGSANIFNVLIADADASLLDSSSLPLTLTEESVEKELDSLVEIDPLAVCKKIVNETCHQQLMTSLMLETLTAANRELVVHQQQPWLRYYGNGIAGSSVPMMMPPVALPVAMPMFVPVPASVNQPNAANSLVAPIGNRSTSTKYDENNARMGRPQKNDAYYGAQNVNSFNSPAYGVDSRQQQNREDGAHWGHSPDNASLGDRCEGFSGAGDMGGAYRNTGRGADRSSFEFGSQNQGGNFGSASNEDGNFMSPWLTADKRRRGRRGGRGSGSPGNRMTAWERAVAADRANRKMAAGDAD